MTDLLQQYSQQATIMTPKISMGLVVLLIFWIIGIIVEKVTLVVGNRAKIQKDIIKLLGRVARIVLLILGIVSGLGTMGINVSALVASLGLTGFALGFALKDALSNVLAGVLVLIYDPFDVGDTILITGFEGKVVQIDLRYTTLKSDDKTILIPNSNLFNNPVVIKHKSN